MNKFTYNMFHEIQRPTVILSSVHHKHYGVLENIDYDSFSNNFNMNSAQEISFDVYKYLDEHKCSLWEKLISFKYLYIPDHNEYYKIDVTLDQDDKTVKHITGTSAGEYELSQRKIQAMDINTPDDATYYEQKLPDGSYEPIPTPKVEYSMFYNPDDPHKSILDRAIADRAPDWSIGHVDSSIIAKKRICTFTVSNQTIYDFLVNSVANEFDVLFKFDSVNRIINAYDLLNMCEDCLERGDFTDVCPKCGGTHIRRGYGNDSHIYISANNYASKITVDGDEGNVKNCFRLIGGDDNITATAMNCNPSGGAYIYQFSEADYDDMPEELVEKLEDYAELYEEYENGVKTKGDVTLPSSLLPITINLGFKPLKVVVSYTDGQTDYTVVYKNEVSIGDGGTIEVNDNGFVFKDHYPTPKCSYEAYSKEPYSEITTDYYNALAEYYYYQVSMMPRTDNSGKDIGHWKPTTDDSHPQTYDVGDTCYTITLPSYCYLKCIKAGRSGHVEFDCTNVIPSDDPAEPKVIKEHDFDSSATVEWEVVRNIVSVPSAEQTLEDIKTYVADNNTIAYFQNNIPGVTSNPPQYRSINNNVRDLIQTTINPLIKIDLLDDPEGYWETTEWFPEEQGQPRKPKAGNLHFYLRVTNTTNTEDVAETVRINEQSGDPEWYTLSMKCRVADSLKQHQDYMMEYAEKKLKRKDTNFTHIYQTEKRKDGDATLNNGNVTVNLDFTPEYVVTQYVTSEHLYVTVHTYDNTTEHYLDGKLASGAAVDSLVVNNNGFTFSTTIPNVDTIFYTAVSDVDFRTVIKQYSLDLLDGFSQSYDACRMVLNEYGDPSKDFNGVDIYHSMYVPYVKKYDELVDEMNVRVAKVKEYYNNPYQDNTSDEIPVGKRIEYDSNIPPGLIQRLTTKMNEVHTALNLQKFLEDPEASDPDWMWKVFFNYLREGEYQNNNLISDGLSENEQVQRGMELLEKGRMELKKATELQYSLSDDLGNLLNTEEFAPFKDKFELGDYIICGVGDNKENLDVDDHNYKLRLISLSYDYGNPESVSVTFANVTKIKNYFSDTQDILAQAKSMGTSYNAVTHQVEKNADTTSTVNSWNANGLNSSLTRIMNNNQEEVTYDNNGILIREYDYTYDENKDNAIYTDEQLKITHNVLAFTKDNWKTASLGLGKQDYIYYDSEKKLKTGNDYGLIAKFVDAGYIHGSQIISGEIFSENYDVTNNIGSHINLKDGTFEVADGKFKFYYDNGIPKLYIDADSELHGDLTVYTDDTPNKKIIFKADTGNHSVKIGGWTAGATNLWIQNGANYVTLSDGSNANQDVMVIRQGTEGNYTYPYHLHADGSITMAKATVTGTVTANNGKIGNWTINDGLVYANPHNPNLYSNLSPSEFAIVGSYTSNTQPYIHYRPGDGESFQIGEMIYTSGGVYDSSDKYLTVRSTGDTWCKNIYVGSGDPQSGDAINVYSTLSNIGTTLSNSATVQNVGNTAYKSITNITLSAGTWVVKGKVNFNDDSSSSGNRAIMLATTADANAEAASSFVKVLATTSGQKTQMITVGIMTVSTSTTVYVTSYHNGGSGVTFNVDGNIQAVRIK